MSNILFQYEDGSKPLSGDMERSLMNAIYECESLADFANVVKSFKGFGIKKIKRSAFMNINGQALPRFIWKAMRHNQRWFDLNVIYAEIAKKRLNGEQV